MRGDVGGSSGRDRGLRALIAACDLDASRPRQTADATVEVREGLCRSTRAPRDPGHREPPKRGTA